MAKQADDKKGSFVFHLSYRKQLEKMTHEERGKLIINLMDLIEGAEPTYPLEAYAEGVFDCISDRMLEEKAKYNERCEKSRKAIEARWNKQKKAENTENNPKNDTNVYERKKRIPIDTDIDTDTDTDIDTDIDTDTDIDILHSKECEYNIYNKCTRTDRNREIVLQDDDQGERARSSGSSSEICIIGKGKQQAVFIKPSLQQVREYCKERNNGISPERFVDYYEARGWMQGKNPMKDWKAAVRSWEHSGVEKQGTDKRGGDKYGGLDLESFFENTAPGNNGDEKEKTAEIAEIPTASVEEYQTCGVSAEYSLT